MSSGEGLISGIVREIFRKPRGGGTHIRSFETLAFGKVLKPSKDLYGTIYKRFVADPSEGLSFTGYFRLDGIWIVCYDESESTTLIPLDNVSSIRLFTE